jgi:hypothetical protein
MGKKPPAADSQSVAHYERLVATVPEIERKGAALPYTSLNGNMFSLLTREGTLALRLPEAEREAFLSTYRTTLVEQYGVVMKEYVAVPAGLLADTDELAPYFRLSVAYARTLRPKPTTRPKKISGSKKPAKAKAGTKAKAKPEKAKPRRAR